MELDTPEPDELHTCRGCGESIVPQRHDDTGLSCPECGIAISYSDVSHYRTTSGGINNNNTKSNN